MIISAALAVHFRQGWCSLQVTKPIPAMSTPGALQRRHQPPKSFATGGLSLRARPGDHSAALLNLPAGALQALDQLSAERRDLEKAFRWEWDNDDVIKGRAQGPAYDPDQPFREGLQR